MEDMFDCWIEPEESYDALEDNYVDDFEYGYEDDELPKSTRKERRNDSQSILDRSPPQNLNAERAVLGIYLVHPELRSLNDEINFEMFYFDANRKVFSAMVEMEHLDGILLEDELSKRGQLEMVGGTSYLVELHKVGLGVNPEHLQDYTRIIREKRFRRDFIHCLSNVLRRLYYDDKGDNNEIFGELEQSLKNLGKISEK